MAMPIQLLSPPGSVRWAIPVVVRTMMDIRSVNYHRVGINRRDVRIYMDGAPAECECAEH